MSKKKKSVIIAGSVLAFVIVGFFVTSFVLAGVHGHGANLVAEWQSWGAFFKDLFEFKK